MKVEIEKHSAGNFRTYHVGFGLSGNACAELDKLAGDPVDVMVNGRLVARGEVLVLNDTFSVRISEIVSAREQALISA